MKLKHCPLCDKDLPRDVFTSIRAKYCNPCKRIRELEQARARKIKQLERLKKKKQKKKVQKSISELKRSAQRVFNKWIRNRDSGLPCISCGKHVEKYEAGHYLAQGMNGLLRYEPDNVHNQCTSCNRWKSGNLIEYRIGLVKKIGEQRVKELESMRGEIKRWTREELTEILEKYKSRKD